MVRTLAVTINAFTIFDARGLPKGTGKGLTQRSKRTEQRGQSYVDVRDVAAVAAKALTSEGHSGRVYELNGPEAITQDELVKRIAGAAGRPVRHVTVAKDEYREGLVDAGVPEWMASAELDLQEYFQSGKAAVVDGLIAKLLGRPERTIDQFLAEVAGEFRQQSSNAGA